MNTVINLFRNLRNALRCIGELVGYLLRFTSMFLQTRASLAARLMQPATVKKWRTRAFRMYWTWKSRRRAGRRCSADTARATA